MDDLISRRAAIDALWKALYEYEDKTEKQFIESEELDVGDWFLHRIFVQNMSDIDIQTILNLPSAQRWIPVTEGLPEKDGLYLVTYQNWGALEVDWNIWIAEQKPSWLWEQGVTAWMPLPEAYEPTKEDKP